MIEINSKETDLEKIETKLDALENNLYSSESCRELLQIADDLEEIRKNLN